MSDQKLSSTRFEMGIGSQHRCTLNETAVSGRRVCVCGCTSIVEGSKNAWRAFLLNEVADDLVVKVFDRVPLDLLPNVLLLLCLQRKLDEDLLQFLIYVVDAKLFKRIILEDHRHELNEQFQ